MESLRQSSRLNILQENVPSFMAYHSYAKTSVKRKETLQTPTNLGPTKTPWTTTEKNILRAYVAANEFVPNEGASKFWSLCAENLNTLCRSSRTGPMCRSYYRNSQKLELTGTSVDVQTVPGLPILQNKKQTLAKTTTTTGMENEYTPSTLDPSELGNTPSHLNMRKRSASTCSDISVGQQELRILQVETLQAEKDKYICETEMMKMKKEKLIMQKELLHLKIKRVKLELVEKGYDPNLIT